MRQRALCPVVLGLAAVTLAVTGCSSGTVTPSPTVAVTPVVTTSPSPTPTSTPAPTPTPTPRSSPTLAHGPVGFTATGNMTDFRDSDTATLLPDGRVLIAGGRNAWGSGKVDVLASAELYDPATGKFTATGSMAQARWTHTATLLADGRVLIAGGRGTCTDKCALTDTAELYDPATGTFSGTGSLPDGFFVEGAAALLDGHVLVTGFNTGTVAAELYDPATGTWSPTGPLQDSRLMYTVTSLRDGRVLVTGGYLGTFSGGQMTSEKDLASAFLYDPTTGRWSATGSMLHARADAVATSLADGRVLVVAGRTVTGSLTSSAEIYNPTTGRFTATGSTGITRDIEATATLLLDGRVLFAGGDGAASPLSSAQIYNSTTGKFGGAKSLVNARFFQTATLLPDGRVLIAGGDDRDKVSGMPVSLNSAELYQP